LIKIRTVWLIAIVSVLVIFSNLGGAPLLDPDEPVYAETPKEMLISGDFISPRIYGDYWYDKPPMYYWLVAAAFKIFGVSEFSARVPSACLAVLCAFAVYVSGRRLLGNGAALAGALILVTSVEYFYLAKAAVTDITLTLFLTIALLSFLEKKYYLFYIFAGLATLTKGPIGFLFPGAVVFLYLLLTRNFSQLKHMKIPAGMILFSLVALPWYVTMYQLHGAAFIETFLGFHNVTRFMSPEHPEGVLWYYYIPVLIIGFFPWTPVLVQSVWASLTKSRGDEKPVLLFLLIWAVFIFLFFTLSQTKLVSYILPMYPPLAMITGWYINGLWTTGRPVRLWSWPIALVTLSLILAGALFVASWYIPLPQNGVIAAAALLLATAFAGAHCLWRRKTEWAFGVQVAGMVFFSAVLVTVILPAAAPYFSSKDVARQFLIHYDGRSEVYVIKFLHPGFAFYTDVYGHELETTEQLKAAVRQNGKAYFVVGQSEYNLLPEGERQRLTVVSTEADKVLLLKY
jgi:4-amino-4-deoxy-L-arabinose transferase-like glycosyltransferase